MQFDPFSIWAHWWVHEERRSIRQLRSVARHQTTNHSLHGMADKTLQDCTQFVQSSVLQCKSIHIIMSYMQMGGKERKRYRILLNFVEQCDKVSPDSICDIWSYQLFSKLCGNWGLAYWSVASTLFHGLLSRESQSCTLLLCSISLKVQTRSTYSFKWKWKFYFFTSNYLMSFSRTVHRC